MTKIVKKEMYCPECKKTFVVPVMLSTNSYMIELDASLKKRYEEGTLFKNYCPECKSELVNKKEEK